MSTVISDTDARIYVAANIQHRLGTRSTYWLMKATKERPNRIYPVVRGDAMATAGLLCRIAEALACTTDALLAKPSKKILENFSSRQAKSA